MSSCLRAEWCSFVSMNHIFCFHSSILGHLGCFQILAITIKAAMNIVEHVTLYNSGVSFGYILKMGIAGSSGTSISILCGISTMISRRVVPLCNPTGIG